MKRFEGMALLVLPYILLLGVAVMRLQLANPLNIVPVFSCLLFFAAVRPAREMVLPLALLVGVDVFITTHAYGYAVTADSLVTWTWYMVAMLLGAGLLGANRSWQRVAGCSLAASVSFFVVSNFTVWAAWSMYPKTMAGLGACYVAALPFFRNAVTSELCFSLVLFGLASRLASLVAMRSAGKAHC